MNSMCLTARRTCSRTTCGSISRVAHALNVLKKVPELQCTPEVYEDCNAVEKKEASPR